MSGALEISDLTVTFGETPVVRGVQLRLAPGEIVGLVGESGSGKTVTCLSALRLHGEDGEIAGQMRIGDTDILGLDDAGLSRMRGAAISMIFQDPTASLNPIKSIGRQIVETIRRHTGRGSSEARAHALSLLAQVGLPDPTRAFAAFPHQLSGGMNQRAMIAVALAADPALLIADEPTTALDVTIQAQILDLLRALRNERRMGILLVTHDLGVVAEISDRVAVMYAGELVEMGPTSEVLTTPHHPYTRGLLAALPSETQHGALTPIEGTVPPPRALPEGCVFAPRCPEATKICRSTRPTLDQAGHRALSCHHPVTGRLHAAASAQRIAKSPPAPLLRVAGLSKRFKVDGKGFFAPRRDLIAVDDLSFDLGQGETLAVVGESGCGKSTVARMLLGVYPPSAGKITFDGTELSGASEETWREARTDLQLVFQDPLGALNPRIPVGQQITEPLRLYRCGTAKEHEETLQTALARLGLDPSFANRFPHQLSGGQRQRVVLARAMVLEPKLLVCDEPIAALDVSVQAQVINLLGQLQAETGLSLLFISHDLRIVRHIAHRVAVMYLGRIVETGPTETVFAQPRHPYTQALLSAIPRVDPTPGRTRIALEDEPPDPASQIQGCRFHSRCPVAEARCRTEEPSLQGGVACHLAGPVRAIAPRLKELA